MRISHGEQGAFRVPARSAAQIDHHFGRRKVFFEQRLARVMQGDVGPVAGSLGRVTAGEFLGTQNRTQDARQLSTPSSISLWYCTNPTSSGSRPRHAR